MKHCMSVIERNKRNIVTSFAPEQFSTLPLIAPKKTGQGRQVYATTWAAEPVYQLRREGLPVHPGPPGMSPLDDGEAGRKILKPEEFVSYKYTGRNYFGSDLLPGKYQIQFRYENTLPQKGDWTGTIETDWLDFEVTKPLLRGRKSQ